MSRNQEAAFIAGITAGTTHEIRNILAIVKESAGLIEDLIRAFERRKSLDQDKLMRALSRIDAQVSRGAEVLSHLNRFAHSLDHSAERLDLDQVLRQVVFLGQIAAKRKRHVLQVRAVDQNQSIVTAPFQLQMALLTALQCCMEQLPEGSTVIISLTKRGNRPSVEFTAEEGGRTLLPAPTEAVDWPPFLQILEHLDASVEVASAGYGFRLMLPTTEAS